MEIFFENLPMICLLLGLLLCLGCGIYYLATAPKQEKIAALREWLKWAVTIAEIELGSGTGQIKLREVYNMAISQFSWLVNCISFEQFSLYVDEALEWMRKQIENNKDIKNFVMGYPVVYTNEDTGEVKADE